MFRPSVLNSNPVRGRRVVRERCREVLQPSLVLTVNGDLYGATRADCRAAFFSRPRQAVFPLGTKPDYFARDLSAVAVHIVENPGPSRRANYPK